MPETWVADSGGVKRKVTGWWVGDPAGVRREVVKVWAGDSGGVPRVVYENFVLLTTVKVTVTGQTTATVSWTATPGCTYQLFRTGGPSATGPLTGVTSSLSYNDSGLQASSTYTYRVDVYRGGVLVGSPTASGTTQSPPPPPATSSASVNGPGVASGGGWVSSTAYALRGASVSIRGYVSSFNLYCGGRSGRNGYVTPVVNGVAWTGTTVAPGLGYKGFAGGNTWCDGSITVGGNIGGNTSYETEWRMQAGHSNWRTSIAWGTINYWWYTRAADGRSVQSVEPWWRDEYSGVDIHVESWVDSDGEVIRAVITDKESGDLLREWERM